MDTSVAPSPPSLGSGKELGLQRCSQAHRCTLEGGVGGPGDFEMFEIQCKTKWLHSTWAQMFKWLTSSTPQSLRQVHHYKHMLLQQAQFKPTELYLNSSPGLNISTDIRIIKTLVDGFAQSLKKEMASTKPWNKLYRAQYDWSIVHKFGTNVFCVQTLGCFMKHFFCVWKCDFPWIPIPCCFIITITRLYDYACSSHIQICLLYSTRDRECSFTFSYSLTLSVQCWVHQSR